MTKKQQILEHLQSANGLTNPAIACSLFHVSYNYAKQIYKKYAIASPQPNENTLYYENNEQIKELLRKAKA